MCTGTDMYSHSGIGRISMSICFESDVKLGTSNTSSRDWDCAHYSHSQNLMLQWCVGGKSRFLYHSFQ